MAISWISYALLSAFAAALVAIFGKIGIEGVDPMFATMVRSIIMAGVLIVTAGCCKKMSCPPEINLTSWFFIFLSAIAGALGWLFYFSALHLGPATHVVTLERL